MGAAERLLAAAVLVGALSPSACRKKAAPAPPPPPRPALAAVAVENMSPAGPESPAVDEAAVESQLRKVLTASGLFAPGSDARAPLAARARLTISGECVEVGAKGEARAQVRLRIDTRPSDAPGAVELDLQGQGVEPYAVPAARPAAGEPAGPQPPSLTALVQRIARDLVEGVAARRRLQEGAPAVLHAVMVGDAGELREEAIRIVGERQIREEVPTLLKLLSDQDETVRDAALGALIAMKERSAVRELTQSRSLRDRREMRKIIEAISILGGQEADEYLSFVAATHDDDEIRAAAAAARARMQRREAEAGH